MVTQYATPPHNFRPLRYYVEAAINDTKNDYSNYSILSLLSKLAPFSLDSSFFGDDLCLSSEQVLDIYKQQAEQLLLDKGFFCECATTIVGAIRANGRLLCSSDIEDMVYALGSCSNEVKSMFIHALVSALLTGPKSDVEFKSFAKSLSDEVGLKFPGDTCPMIDLAKKSVESDILDLDYKISDYQEQLDALDSESEYYEESRCEIESSIDELKDEMSSLKDELDLAEELRSMCSNVRDHIKSFGRELKATITGIEILDDLWLVNEVTKDDIEALRPNDQDINRSVPNFVTDHFSEAIENFEALCACLDKLGDAFVVFYESHVDTHDKVWFCDDACGSYMKSGRNHLVEPILDFLSSKKIFT